MDDTTTLKEVKDHLNANINKGCKCPACAQEVRLYPRAMNSIMARFLIALFRAPKTPEGWVDVRTLDFKGGDYAKARYWGLCEVKANKDPRKRTSGLWRLTAKGTDFIHDRVRVPSHALVYNKKCHGLTGGDIDIRRALGTDFDYEKLMA